MALGDINVTVNTSVMTIGRVRVQLPTSLPATQLPITIKNIAGDLPTVQQLRNVNVVSANGSEILVFNANTNNFDVRDLTGSDISLEGLICDGGSF